MGKWMLLVFSLVVFLSTSSIASAMAVKGGVVYCDGKYAVVALSDSTYTCLEFTGVNDFSKGDIVIGDLQNIRFHDLYDDTTDTSASVLVDACFDTASTAANWVVEKEDGVY